MDSAATALVLAARKALVALVDEIDHYASVDEAPESTLAATHDLRRALEAHAMLCDPPLHVAFAPHAALRQLGHRLWEALRSSDLIRSLTADGKQSAYLGGADKFHALSVGVALDTVKRRIYSTLDTVKRG